MKLNTLVRNSFLACGLAFAWTGAQAAETVTLQMAHEVDLEHSGHKTIVWIAEELEKASGGKMKIQIYPSGQMGNMRELMELLQSDALDMTYNSANGLETFADIYSIYNLPYLFKDRDHFNKVVYGPIGDEIKASTHDKGFVSIGSYAAGTRSFYTKKPIKSLDDLKGMKLRVPPSPTMLRTVELLGGLPTPVAFSESYTALQQGVVDGAENNIPSYVHTRHSEVAKYYTQDEHSSFPDFLVISTRALDQLTKEQRALLLDVVKRSETWQQTLWDNLDTENRKKAEQAGVSFSTIDKEPFRKAVKPLHDEYMAKSPENAALLKKIQDASS